MPPCPRLAIRNIPRHLWSTLRGASHWRWGNALLFFVLIGGITGLFALLNFQGAVVSQLLYFVKRPPQIESMGSIFLWIAHSLGVPFDAKYDFGSVNITSPLNPVVSL